MQRDLQLVECKCLRLACAEDMHVIGQVEPPGDLAFGIVIAVEQVDRDTFLVEPPHLRDEEQPGLVVPPVAVIQIPGDDNKIGLLLDDQSNQRIKRLAGRCAHSRGGVAFLAREAP